MAAEKPVADMSGVTAEAEAQETRTAFFYGTLLAPQVFYSVCYGDPDPPQGVRDRHAFAPAVLHGYCRRRVRRADYPGMVVADPGHRVVGAVVGGLTGAHVQRLDLFEGSQYDRRVVRPRLLAKMGDEKGGATVEGEEVVTESYVFLDEGSLEPGEWDFAEFKRDKLATWTRAGYVFEDCDPGDLATASGDR